MSPFQLNSAYYLTGILAGALALLGMPRCNDLMTRADAKTEHQRIETRIDRLETNQSAILHNTEAILEYHRGK